MRRAAVPLLVALALLVVGAPVARAATRGVATWYDDGPGIYAAAGPSLRHALGPHWRGQTVKVTSAKGSVIVKLTDWCACGKRHGQATVLDLSIDAFRRIGSPSAGVVAVRVTRLANVKLPATDTAPSPSAEVEHLVERWPTTVATVGVVMVVGALVGLVVVLTWLVLPDER